MAGTLQVFKDQAIVKRELEQNRERTEIELRNINEIEPLRHKSCWCEPHLWKPPKTKG